MTSKAIWSSSKARRGRPEPIFRRCADRCHVDARLSSRIDALPIGSASSIRSARNLVAHLIDVGEDIARLRIAAQPFAQFLSTRIVGAEAFAPELFGAAFGFGGAHA